MAKSQLKCSAMVLTAALDALYAGLPGGLVIPCLDPVMMIEAGEEAVDEAVTRGRRVVMPLITPKRFTESVF